MIMALAVVAGAEVAVLAAGVVPVFAAGVLGELLLLHAAAMTAVAASGSPYRASRPSGRKVVPRAVLLWVEVVMMAPFHQSLSGCAGSCAGSLVRCSAPY
jgi:hypothetical protein